MSIRIKDWKKFQHFKDRRPLWIKLYRDILDDPDWHALDAKSSKILVMLWLVASEDESQEGTLPDMRKVAFRLRITETELSKEIQKLRHYLIFDDISLISDGYHSDALEKEKEKEKETEKEKEYCAESLRISEPELAVEPVMFIPIIGKEKEFAVTQKDIDEWQTTFPGVDVLSDLRKCRQWNKDHVAKRKTKRGIRGHISSWLGRTQDSGKGRQQHLPAMAVCSNQQTADRNARLLLGIE